MSLASKIGWAEIALTLLTTGMLVQGFPQSAAGSDANQEKVSAFVMKNEITKMQEILRDKGHYRGKVDGVFGLRTRASIRAYQKAENFPVTGQVDRRTADGLGLRPESNWGNSTSARQEVGHGEKPSAGIKWGKDPGRTNKTLGKTVKTVAATESGREDRENTLQAENEKHPR